MPLEEVIAGPGALEQGMTAAAGTTHPKEGTFGGTTALMVLITTLIEKTNGQGVATGGSGTLWCSGALVLLMDLVESGGP